jgi:cytochrome c2
MKKIALFFAAGLFFATMLSSCMESTSPKTAAKPVMTKEEMIKKGEYLVTTIGCNDCHSPKTMGERGPEVIPALMLSGYPGDRPLPKVGTDALKNGWGLFNSDMTTFVGPWGESFAGNITSDATGIGNWNIEQFKKAITQGKFKGMEGGRMLLPPMPWTEWGKMKEEDVEAIFAYLKSTPPVRNIVPMPIPPDKLMAEK